MARIRPPLNALPAFLAAGRHASFSKAAEELNVSHTSVLRHVRNLEDRLGTKLFEKSGRNVTLTDAGRRYHRELSPLFDEIGTLTDRLFAQQTRAIRISSERIFAYNWLIGRLYASLSHAFLETHPLDIQASDELVDVETGGVDIAIRFLSDPPRANDAELLMRAYAYPFAAPGYGGLDPDNLDLKALSKMTLEYARWPKRWVNWFTAAGLKRPRTPNLNQQYDFQHSVQAARVGKTALLVPRELVDTEIESGNLIQLSDIGMEIGGIYLIISKQARSRQGVMHVVDQIRDLAANLPK